MIKIAAALAVIAATLLDGSPPPPEKLPSDGFLINPLVDINQPVCDNKLQLFKLWKAKGTPIRNYEDYDHSVTENEGCHLYSIAGVVAIRERDELAWAVKIQMLQCSEGDCKVREGWMLDMWRMVETMLHKPKE